MSRRVPIRLAMILALAAAAAFAARAETTLLLTSENVSCVDVHWRPGAPEPTLNSSFCAPSIDSPVTLGVFQSPGTTDFLYARHLTYLYGYSYEDDGLATGDSTFESATLSFRTLSGSSSSFSTSINVFGAPADAFSFEWGGAHGTALVLGDNDHPDSFSGMLRVEFRFVGEGSVSIGGLEPILSISSAPDGGVPPIPEPSTYALMLAGLGAIGLWTQRRRAASASR